MDHGSSMNVNAYLILNENDDTGNSILVTNHIITDFHSRAKLNTSNASDFNLDRNLKF